MPGFIDVDSFAGGGGASLGIEAALGRPVDIAIDHGPEAIAMHATTIQKPATTATRATVVTAIAVPRANLALPLPFDSFFHDNARVGDNCMTDWNTCPAVERNPRRISGAWTFTGTRIPVHALFENLATGATVDEFVEWFPGVDRQQVLAVLDHEAKSLRTETGL